MAGETFWNWSLRVYENPATRRACLDLQDRCSQDVNTLLWAGWLAMQGKSPTTKALALQHNISQDWQSGLIGGIRKARRSIGQNIETDSAAALKSEFLALELMLEKREQEALEALPVTNAPSHIHTEAALCRHNLEMLLNAQGLDDSDCMQAIDVLIASFF